MQASDPSSLQWWQKTIVYQIYPRSFQDSTGDGVGDLQGIISRVDHFVDIGVGAVWLSPFYPSPQLDFGYDISDFCDVDKSFGTLEDFDRLVQIFHEKGIKVLIDFVPGHSSHLHPWFLKSVNREDPYTDYYVWHDGKLDADGKRVPPNNWLSVFGGSSWSWNEQRQQFYYRPFIPEQPKLNYRCPQLAAEMKKVLCFWLDRGVDGMRLDAISVLVESEDKSLDEPRNMKASYPPVREITKNSSFKDQYEYLNHIHTELLPESFELIQQWSDILKEYSTKESKFMVIEIYEVPERRNKYRNYGGVPFNMDLTDYLETIGLSGENVKRVVDSEYANLPKGAWPSFVIGNHDRHRVTRRHGPRYSDAFNMLLLTLKGTPTTYYGEEIAMDNIEVSFEDTQDPFGINMGPERYQLFSRDPARSPMQWDSNLNSGFSQAAKCWLPVSPNFKSHNVKVQANMDGPSPLKLYKTLSKLRQEPAFLSGSLSYGLVNSEIFSYIREDPSTSTRFLVALNFGKKLFRGHLGQSVANASHGLVVASTCLVDPSVATGQKVSLEDISMSPGDGLVIKLGA